jgi:hypothetical protein
MTRFFG